MKFLKYFICRRSPSSLKSPNSPTCGQRKSVRFTDSIGLDLVHVKLFQSEGIDRYAVNDDFFESESALLSFTKRRKLFHVMPSLAAAPNSSNNFHERYLFKHFTLRNVNDVFKTNEEQKVCLESLSTIRMSVSGLIQVENIAFEKKVINFESNNNNTLFLFSFNRSNVWEKKISLKQSF